MARVPAAAAHLVTQGPDQAFQVLLLVEGQPLLLALLRQLHLQLVELRAQGGGGQRVSAHADKDPGRRGGPGAASVRAIGRLNAWEPGDYGEPPLLTVPFPAEGMSPAWPRPLPR